MSETPQRVTIVGGTAMISFLLLILAMQTCGIRHDVADIRRAVQQAGQP